ncbi:hypothetical protein Nepgr_028966 [Nepenthes gracilis]|uniref:Uncharacterized protein n=1 Tax=Nepenthes gracilis TaxID=150966 RepID=A0AAD3TBP1_NEPGR|nr:hypothetical protein Nepgr_028966 [Nepenthes gracilis]
MGIIPKATKGEQVAAGWPPWLVVVAGEATKGWVPRWADSFEKLNKIGPGTYPLSLMETLLSIDPSDHGSAASALKSEFFTTKPLPCDPSSLPKYLPSKEFDAKVRDEEGRRRQGAAGNKGRRLDPESKKSQSQPNLKSRSEKFNPNQEEVASGFPIEPPRPFQTMEESINSSGQIEIIAMEGAQVGIPNWTFMSRTYGVGH